MKGEEIRGMRDEVLAEQLKKLRGRLFTLRSQVVTEKVEDTTQFGKIRRDVARILTEQRARRGARG